MQLPINHQPISKQSINTNGALLVHHFFFTIQGEGPFVGQPAVFMRLAGCNLRCPQCDTDYTSETPTSNRLMSVEEVYESCKALVPEKIWKNDRPALVVISGGEPFRQNIGPAVQRLAGPFTVQIETNGTLSLPPWKSDENETGFPYTDENVLIVCSPKAGKLDPLIEKHAMALKYVLNFDDVDEEDGLPVKALRHSASPRVARPPPQFLDRGGEVYLQPADTGDLLLNAKNTRAVLDSCMKFGYTLCLQTHKIVGLE